MKQQQIRLIVLFIFVLVQTSFSVTLYSTGISSYRNQTWMTDLDYGLPIREISILGTRNSIQTMDCIWLGGFQDKQSNNIQNQLLSGIRALDVRFKHNNNKFDLYDRSCSLGVNFDNVLTVVQSFLTTYPGETVLLHLVEEQGASGCTRTIEDTFIFYRDSYPGLFWTPTSQDPQLGQVRGMVVVLQQFNAVQIHGLLWATFTVLPSKSMSTNWDLYDKWLAVKSFAAATNTAKKSRIAYWTGQGFSYPYFVVSGKSSMNGGRLVTGLTTPGFKNSYPDFPRVACFIGICSIVFEGMNIMGYNYITNQGFTYTGIIYTDFYGDDLLIMVLNKNKATYNKCTALQTSQGCTLCQTGSGLCIKCNTNMHYVYEPINKTCLAQTGYYLNATYIPNLCSDTMPGCTECTSATVCLVCDTINNYALSNATCIAAPGYYLNASFFPVPCPQTGCAQCLDAVSCSLCSAPTNYIMDDSTNYTCKCDNFLFFTQAPAAQACICMVSYFLTANSTCDPMPKCPDMTGGCLNCSGSVCLQCDAANNFTLDPTLIYCVCQPLYYFTGVTCSLCNTLDLACDECANANLCLSCVDNFTLNAGVCKCNYSYFLVDGDTCNSCEVGCLVCTGIGSCTACDATNFYTLVAGFCDCVVGRFQSNGTCIPCGSMAGCIDCNSGGCIACEAIFGFHLNVTICECNPDFFINDMQICEQCMMDGCMNCLNQTFCTECDPAQFFLNTSTATCDDICGDGIKIYVECDDNNTADGDGCSSQCKVETDYTCIGGSRTSSDACSYSGPFYMAVVQTIKDQKQNKIYIKSTIKPNILSLQTMNFSAIVNPTFPIDQKQVTFDPNTSTISMEVSYTSSLNSLSSSNLQVSFQPDTAQPEYFFMKTASFYLPQVTDNNLALKYYDEQIYGLLELMKTISNVTAFLYIGAFLICFLFVSKLIAIQLILVPQIAFAGLIMIQKLQALLQPLSGFNLTNGYNPMFADTNPLPPRLSVLFFGGNFMTNFNVCAVVALLPFVVGLSMLIVGKVQKRQKMEKWAYKALKEWLFSFLLVFQFQFTVALGIDIQFGSSMMGKLVGGVFIATLIAFLIMFYKKPDNFGQFKRYFVQSPVAANFYIGIVLFRIILALDLIVLSQNTLCGFMVVTLAAVYIIVLIVIRPYLNNIRPLMNMTVTLAILIIYSIYKLNFYSPEATFITSYLPLFIIALLLLLLLANVIFMIFALREKITTGQIDKYQKKDEIDEEFKKEMDRQMSVIAQIQLALNPTNLVNVKERQKDEMELEGLKIEGYQELRKKKHELNISLSGSQMMDEWRFVYEDL